MAYPIISYNHCFDTIPKNRTVALAVPISALIFDVAVFITCLTIGILSLVAENPHIYVTGVSPAAAYALIGVGSSIALLYVAMAIQSCIERSQENSKKPISRTS